MKKIILTYLFLIVSFFQSSGQINPVINLTLENDYEAGNYYFALQWEEPALPHDEIIGYNVYRDEELYRFQTQLYLTNLGFNPNCGQDFMQFESDGDGFYIHVTAVYGENQIESSYTETLFALNNTLGTDLFSKQNQVIYPNPTNGVINLPHKNLIKILIYDISGNLIKELQPQPQLNLSGISKGLYLIKLISNEEVFISKILIK